MRTSPASSLLNLGMPFAKVARNYVYINEAVKRVVEARAPD